MAANTADRRREDDAVWERLKSDRSQWEPHFKELADYFGPRTLRLNLAEGATIGRSMTGSIVNSVTRQAVTTASAGLFSWVTSPARPWFNYGLSDPDLENWQPAKEYLEECTRRMRSILAGSNYYQAIPNVYTSLIVHGTAAMHIDEDDQDVLRCYPFQMGTYALATSARGNVDTIAREFSLTVRQAADEYGRDKLPPQLRQQLISNPETKIARIIQLCQPNREYDARMLHAQHKKYRSVVFIPGQDGYLRESGYDNFPVMAPRWMTEGNDVWGISPCMDALPDAKSLMLYERRMAQAIEKQLNPPTQGPASIDVDNLLPGDHIATTGEGKITSIYAADAFRLDFADNKIQRIESSINRSLFVDLFLALMNSDRRQITAEEIRAKQEERILALGQPLERLNNELLGPSLERAFVIAERAGLMPEPPDELRGQTLQINYVSVLHKVQKMAKLGELDRLAQYVGSLAALFPQVVDKFDADQAVDEYADGLGAPTLVTRSDEDVAQVRQSRAQAQQQQQQMDMTAQNIAGAKVLSQTDTGGQNALTDLIQRNTQAAL